MRALLGTASHFCEVFALKSRTVPNDTAVSLRVLAHGMLTRRGLSGSNSEEERSSSAGPRSIHAPGPSSLSSLLLSSLELSDTTLYESYMRALLGTASHFCEVFALKSRTVPNDTALS